MSEPAVWLIICLAATTLPSRVIEVLEDRQIPSYATFISVLSFRFTAHVAHVYGTTLSAKATCLAQFAGS